MRMRTRARVVVIPIIISPIIIIIPFIIVSESSLSLAMGFNVFTYLLEEFLFFIIRFEKIHVVSYSFLRFCKMQLFAASRGLIFRNSNDFLVLIMAWIYSSIYLQILRYIIQNV